MKKIIKNKNQLAFDFSIVFEKLYKSACIDNIKNDLPELYKHQQEDVLRIEKRFQEGKGFLSTAGTGVGKTFIALGTIKRFSIQNKNQILIVVPTDQKCTDWISEGKVIGLDIYKIKGINDKGIDISVTTYANFYQNEEIQKREYDLVVYDESHYLMQNGQGKDTVYLDKHKVVCMLPSVAKLKAVDYCGQYPDTEDPQFKFKKELWLNKLKEKTLDLVEKTKVLFLSATPFGYVKNIRYADGVLFDIEETIEENNNSFNSYNESSGWNAFMEKHFGYRMRYNKLTVPESGVDQNLMERQFFENMKEQGVMHTRQLEVDKDYSRHFIKISNDLGDVIDEGMRMIRDSSFRDKYKYLYTYAPKRYNYLFINQLLECIKAQEVYKRIQQHLDLGRKVVIFHSYNNSTIKHPFHFSAEGLMTAKELDEQFYIKHELDREILQFNEEFPELINLDISNLKNTRKAIIDRFPNALQFNGTVSKKKRKQNIIDFNDDKSGKDVIVIQQKAGREGISLHDTIGLESGSKQRILINLGLPTEPTAAIQIEGRIYRAGLMSNAIYEYMTMQTIFEKIAFAEKIATRSKTAENLAMGNLARDLETAFKEGYDNWTMEPPSLKQGTGSKEKDRNFQQASDWDKAKTYYWSNAKKTSKNKAKEGLDYFATPEPLGLKMVEWCNPQPSDRGLEPSAGHGAIARFFPTTCDNTFIEPSYELFGRLNMNAKGNPINDRFENYYKGNKHEFVVMNPPFGKGGKVAEEHIRKALENVHWNKGRLVAIVPNGPAMNKRLDKLFDETDFKRDFKLTGEVLLPSVLFERAGTKVYCKVIKIESSFNKENSDGYVNRIDLSHHGYINEFFDELEHLEL